MRKINWKELVIGYNSRYGTDYKNSKEMIICESKHINYEELSYRLGVSDTTLKDKRKQLNIILDRSNSKRQKFIKLFKSGKMRHLSVKHIMEITGIKDKSYVSKLANEFDASFIRLNKHYVRKIDGEYITKTAY